MTARRMLWQILAAASGLGAGVAVTLAVAAIVAWPAVFLAAGGLAALLVWMPCAVRWQRRGKPGRRRAGAAAVVATGLAGLSLCLLLPLGDPVAAPARPPGAGTWMLADGTRIAYGMIRSAAANRGAPVVIVHGGPGVPDLAGHLSVLRGLAADGHDVYAYAQAGAGASSRLADPAKYTAERAVAELDQVRQRIGAGRVILLGHSYGAFVAAAYLAQHPDRVERVVFSSPGDLRDGVSGGSPQRQLSLGQQLRLYALLAPPRALLTYALLQVNPAAAHAFASDRELDARMDRVYAATMPALHCPGKAGPHLHHLGFYANQVPQSLRRPPVSDIRAGLRGQPTPALVVKGQCDYLSWASAVSYVTALPNASLVYLPGAGHDAYLDRPGAYLAAIRAFLADRQVPGTVPDPATAPPGYQQPPAY